MINECIDKANCFNGHMDRQINATQEPIVSKCGLKWSSWRIEVVKNKGVKRDVACI